MKNPLCIFGIHTWSNWKFVNDSSCKQTRVCTKCNIESKSKLVHEWTKGEAAVNNGCCNISGGVLSICLRCNAVNTKKPQAVEPQSGFASSQICDICGKQLDGFMNT